MGKKTLESTEEEYKARSLLTHLALREIYPEGTPNENVLEITHLFLHNSFLLRKYELIQFLLCCQHQ